MDLSVDVLGVDIGVDMREDMCVHIWEEKGADMCEDICMWTCV